MQPHPQKPSSQLTGQTLLARYGQLFKASRRWLLMIVALFIASLISGVLLATLNPDQHREWLRAVGAQLQPALEALRQGDNTRAIGIIFWRNLSITLLILGAGALVFPLLFALLAVGYNAYLLGVVVVLSAQTPGQVAVAILPHGVFELPALIIAAAWSLKMGVAWLLPDATGRRGDVWRETVMEGLWIVPLVTVLLAIAAVVEVLVTGPLTRSLGT